MSGSYNICRIASEELDNVYMVDSRNLSTGIGLQLIHAAEMIERGASAEEIVKAAEELAPRVDASFIIDTLEYLHKGGRCSGVAALGANLLKLKPCIEVKNGKMGVGKKYRGRLSDVMLTYAADRLADADDIITDHVFVTHTMLDGAVAESVAEEVRRLIPCKELHITRAGCTIASHCGPNTLGVLFIRKTPLK